MKTQAWGWLVAEVLAAGLNASYHDGGLQWAHQVADQVEHSSAAVLALASGHAEQFLSEAQFVTAQNEAAQNETARNETASCPLNAALARVQTRLALTRPEIARFDVISAREQAQLARLEANRDRMEAQIEAQVEAEVATNTARIRIPAGAFNPVVFNRVAVRVPQVSVCPRIRVNIPHAPIVRIPAPVIDAESGAGPI